MCCDADTKDAEQETREIKQHEISKNKRVCNGVRWGGLGQTTHHQVKQTETDAKNVQVRLYLQAPIVLLRVLFKQTEMETGGERRKYWTGFLIYNLQSSHMETQYLT